MIQILLVVSFLLISIPCHAADYHWIIGGGADIQTSQVSIEKQVRWINDILRKNTSERHIYLYFNDNSEMADDVVETVALDEDRQMFEPIARLYGKQTQNAYRYRNNALTHVLGATQKETLVPELMSQFSTLKPGDRAFIIFNGHGLSAGKRADTSTLRLWRDTTLSAIELERLIATIDERVPVRFFFPQCYSGGFERIVHSNAKDEMPLARGIRCGFFAHAEDRKSEG